GPMAGCLRQHDLGGLGPGDGGPPDLVDGSTDVRPPDANDGDGGPSAGCPDGSSVPDGCDGAACACAPPLVDLTIAPADPTLPRGAQLPRMAIGTYASGATAELTPQAAWSSDPLAVATIDSAGLLIAVDAGTAVVRASARGQLAQTSVTVTTTTLQSIEVLPA